SDVCSSDLEALDDLDRRGVHGVEVSRLEEGGELVLRERRAGALDRLGEGARAERHVVEADLVLGRERSELVLEGDVRLLRRLLLAWNADLLATASRLEPGERPRLYGVGVLGRDVDDRSEEHTSELQS